MAMDTQRKRDRERERELWLTTYAIVEEESRPSEE
jgi:hypothetical protein